MGRVGYGVIVAESDINRRFVELEAAVGSVLAERDELRAKLESFKNEAIEITALFERRLERALREAQDDIDRRVALAIDDERQRLCEQLARMFKESYAVALMIQLGLRSADDNDELPLE